MYLYRLCVLCQNILRSICDFKWLQKTLQYVNNVLSVSLHRNIGDSDILPEDISFISENNYCGMPCVKHL